MIKIIKFLKRFRCNHKFKHLNYIRRCWWDSSNNPFDLIDEIKICRCGKRKRRMLLGVEKDAIDHILRKRDQKRKQIYDNKVRDMIKKLQLKENENKKSTNC